MSSPMPALTPEFAAAYRGVMLEGLANEFRTTKRVLAAVPDAKSDYRPDPHARSGWELAWHLANTDIQFLNGIADLEFKMGNPSDAEKPKNIAELVTWYEKNYTSGLERVRAMTPAQLMTPVNFLNAFTFPAVFYLAFLNNHSIHHRGELATYLRPMGSKCPSIYGGSYDEPFEAASETAA